MLDKKRTLLLIVIAAVVSALATGTYLVHAQGLLTPPGTPAPTMKRMDEIYAAASGNLSDRESGGGYYGSTDATANATLVLMTVPAGKRFVILKIITDKYFVGSYNGDDTIKVGEKILFKGSFFNGSSTNTSCPPSQSVYACDFPDKCVVANPGETIRLTNGPAFAPYNGCSAVVIGYFCSI